jgi:hypothetical protein
MTMNCSLKEQSRVWMTVEDKLEVSARDRSATVLSSGMICRVDQQNHKRAKIAHQDHELGKL